MTQHETQQEDDLEAEQVAAKLTGTLIIVLCMAAFFAATWFGMFWLLVVRR